MYNDYFLIISYNVNLNVSQNLNYDNTLICEIKNLFLLRLLNNYIQVIDMLYNNFYFGLMF